MTIPFDIPPLYCPLTPHSQHPDLDLLESRALDWLTSVGIASDPISRCQFDPARRLSI
ncbi:MAG TPA: hypothetical protein VJT72_24465 [Pseudonocardiaceae bacterium]|nr:hypothetical protein [Pseudonocardiaceae bacterium]